MQPNHVLTRLCNLSFPFTCRREMKHLTEDSLWDALLLSTNSQATSTDTFSSSKGSQGNRLVPSRAKTSNKEHGRFSLTTPDVIEMWHLARARFIYLEVKKGRTGSRVENLVMVSVVLESSLKICTELYIVYISLLLLCRNSAWTTNQLEP